MATTFVSLAVSATMFPVNGRIMMESVSPKDVRSILESDIVSTLNPSHVSTIEAIRRKFDINLPIPEKAPKVLLGNGDSVLIIQAQLPRLAEGEVHSDETVANAPISFRLWTVDEVF